MLKFNDLLYLEDAILSMGMFPMSEASEWVFLCGAYVPTL